MIVEAVVIATGRKVRVIQSFAKHHHCDNGKSYKVKDLRIWKFVIEDGVERLKKRMRPIE